MLAERAALTIETMETRVLLVDDDVELTELLVDYFSREPLVVDVVHRGDEGLRRALLDEHDVVILDIMLPGMDGLDVLRSLRQKSNVPVVMLTARGDDIDRIVGLELGADDYLPKPFNPRELLARLRAIQRRAERATEERASVDAGQREVLRHGALVVDVGARSARDEGVDLELTGVEFALLELLVRSPGQIVTRETIANQVLGRRFSPLDRSIDVHVSNLRKKLAEQSGARERIKTVRGAGYILLERAE